MILDHKRLDDALKNSNLLQLLKKYAYFETILFIALFLVIGYFVSPEDICLTQKDVPYLVILLSIITLFHGFESGMIAIGFIAIAMWVFYDSFPYLAFSINLLMAMIFSEFYYYWTKQIKELRTDNDYKSTKLNELANAFYTLKISHDQLEKNYVLKPMSIRNAIEEILENNTNTTITKDAYFNDFLALLEKSFHLQGGFILYADQEDSDVYISEDNSEICYSTLSEQYSKKEIFKEYIIDKAINYKQAVYISDHEGNPTLQKKLEESKLLAAIPVIYHNQILALLVIEKMPFIAFNKENLISLAILFEYLLVSSLKQKILKEKNNILFIQDENFRYEYIRSSLLQQKYKVNSTILVFKIQSEIQHAKIVKKSLKMLRSLDLLTSYKYEKFYFIVFLFPLNDKSAAIGFLNRLISDIEDERDKKFEDMIFSIDEERLLEKYIKDDYRD